MITAFFKPRLPSRCSLLSTAVFALSMIAGTAFVGITESTAASSQGTIALSLKTITNDDFQKALADAVKAKVESMGYTFLLVTAGEQTAVSTQVNQVEDLIAKKVTGIVLNPMDGNAVVPVLGKAHEAGIPVVIVDSPVAKGHEDLYITFVGTDNFNAGVQAGKQMAQALEDKGKVLVVRGANGSVAGDNRVDGFKKGLEGSGVTIVGEQPGNWTNSVAMQVTENMLQANKDVQGLFSASDVMLDGTLEALDDAKRKGVVIISVDGSKKAVDLIASGEIFGTMAQFPQKIGALAVEKLVSVIEKKSPADSIPKIIDSGTMMYSKGNLDEARKLMF
jgi:ribose transport system substrate-binding protein